MGISFADQLNALIRSKQSCICIGLDPQIGEKNSIPEYLVEEAGGFDEAIWRFNKAIIDATYDITPVYKPQIAYYEQYNALHALTRTVNYIHSKGSLVLLDAKRNDIGSTSNAYARAVFENFDVDAVTVNPYLGIDGIAPFLRYIPRGKGIFMLLKTSNPSSIDLQDLFTASLPDIPQDQITVTVEKINLVRVYIHMARLMKKWGEDPSLIGCSRPIGETGYSSLGGVVGANFPEQLRAIRKEAPQNIFLIPGYGTQGGSAMDIVHGMNSDGLGAIVNASRSIDFAYQDEKYQDKFSAKEFAEASRIAAQEMVDDINKELNRAGKAFKE